LLLEIDVSSLEEMIMSKKHHGGPGPVPRGNQSQRGPKFDEGPVDEQAQPGENPPASGVPSQEQDPKRRLGDFVGAGEHSIQQPGGKKGANH
jgi:hypothetical protein